MNLLLLKKFNNYFNRKIKKFTELADYKSNSSSYTDLKEINFNPADEVRTELVLGQGQLGQFFDFEKTSCADYLVCYTTTVIPPQNEGDDPTTFDTIESRWFIMDVDRVRGGQYKISLKRDSIADNFDALLSCPAYIKKGIVGDDNPYVLNNEGITVNQKLEDQIPLKDNSTSAWLVGYMAKNFGVDDTVSVQLDDLNIEYKSIEDIATELGVSSNDLSAALTTSRDNPSYIVNDNIELVSWINYVDRTSLEYKILAGSSDGLNSFTYGTPSPILNSHNPTSDCYAKEVYVPYSGALNTTKIINLWKTQCDTYKSAIKAAWKDITGHPLFTRDVYTTLKNYADNQILIYKAGTYYTIKIGAVSGPTNTGDLYSASALASPFSTMCANVISGYNTGLTPSTTTHLEGLNSGKIFINYNELVVNFYLEEVTNQTQVPGIAYTMSSTRNACRDQCYDMFAIPYNNIQIKNGGTTLDGIGEMSQDLSVKLAQKIVLNNTTYQVYDLQLLPYCPIPEICSNGKIDITNLTASKDYDYITQTGSYIARGESSGSMEGNEFAPGMYEGQYYVNTGVPVADFIECGYTVESDLGYTISPVKSEGTSSGNKTITISTLINAYNDATHIDVTVWWTYNTTGTVNKSVVIYPKRASFNVTINKSLTLKDEMKLESNCNNYRLVSPNYQGSFDFNVAKNGGQVNKFFAKCTYKPYSPYIRVVPEFAGLYSTNFPQECRGLICGGDFSLGVINDAWQQYQLQNKNYQNIFNREIQSLDVSQEIAKERKLLSAGLKTVAGGIAGGVKGAKLGGQAGGGYGAAAGAILGTALGAGVTGSLAAADMNWTYREMKEQRDLMLDKFSLQLGNIQALPYTLTKVGAFDIDSMVFPFLEYYTCTEEEKQAFRNKITYEGMTLGIVDDLGKYLANPGYLQAELIRNEDIIDDNHMLEDINLELNKGVYL